MTEEGRKADAYVDGEKIGEITNLELTPSEDRGKPEVGSRWRYGGHEKAAVYEIVDEHAGPGYVAGRAVDAASDAPKGAVLEMRRASFGQGWIRVDLEEAD